jgi:hypothetical protein
VRLTSLEKCLPHVESPELWSSLTTNLLWRRLFCTASVHRHLAGKRYRHWILEMDVSTFWNCSGWVWADSIILYALMRLIQNDNFYIEKSYFLPKTNVCRWYELINFGLVFKWTWSCHADVRLDGRICGKLGKSCPEKSSSNFKTEFIQNRIDSKSLRSETHSLLSRSQSYVPTSSSFIVYPPSYETSVSKPIELHYQCYKRTCTLSMHFSPVQCSSK